MNRIDLNDSFLTTLKEKFSKQSELISAVEDILKIERESAYRRIKGIVQFSIREMGMLAHELNISIDNLLMNNQTNVLQVHMLCPRTEESLEKRVRRVNEYLEKVKIIGDHSHSEMGVVYTNLPMEFYSTYHHLLKFIYFKWGNYYVGPEKYKDFAKWKLPVDIKTYHGNVMKMFDKIKKFVYIWDKSIIWNLTKELSYFSEAGMIEEEDLLNIKSDLHNMLNDLERLVAAGGPKNNSDKIEFYVSHVRIAVTYSYLYSESYSASYITSYSMLSTINENKDTCDHVRGWVKSMKKVSTLISGTCDKERILFFKEQHQIVDTI